MLKNTIILEKIETIKRSKTDLINEKIRNNKVLSEMGITNQAAWKYNRGKLRPEDNSVFVTRSKIVQRNLEIDSLIKELSQQSLELHNLENSDKNRKLIEVFKEIFSGSQLSEIRKEAERRMNGEAGFKMSFDVRNSERNEFLYKAYKKQLLEQLEKMVEFRIMLTKVIEDGCKKFDQGEFLKVISPLNLLIIPLNELNKAKLRVERLEIDYYETKKMSTP